MKWPYRRRVEAVGTSTLVLVAFTMWGTFALLFGGRPHSRWWWPTNWTAIPLAILVIALVLARVPVLRPDGERGFRKKRRVYLAKLRERYEYIEHTNALARPGDIPALPLRQVFVPQRVRAEQPRTELPREVFRRLIANGWLSDRDAPDDVDKDQLARDFSAYADRPPRPVLEAISEHDGGRIVILGDPGTGKSTLSVYLMLTVANLNADRKARAMGGPLADLARYLPFLIELRTYAPAAEKEHRNFRDFLDEIDNPHKPEHPGLSRGVLEPKLDRGKRALVIFDGLDEVFEPRQRNAIQWSIKQFADHYKGVRVVVTSRLTGYERHILDYGHFGHYALEDLDHGKICSFVEQFYSATYPQDGPRARSLAARLLTAIDTNPGVAELAGTPMLLTALALFGRTQELPRDRNAVLEYLVRILIERWDAEKYLQDYLRPPPGVHEKDVLDTRGRWMLLRLVARRIQEGGPGAGGLTQNYIDRDALVDAIAQHFHPDTDGRPLSPEERLRAREAADVIVDQLMQRDYILARFGSKTFGFVHRALLEFFVADEISWRFSNHALSELGIEQLFRDHSTDPQWLEILLLLTAKLEPELSQKAVRAVLDSNRLWYQSGDPQPRHVLLAIRCLGEIRPLGKARSASQDVVRALIEMFETISEPTDYPLAVALTQALERDVLPVLARLGPDWEGWPQYESWYLARGQFLRGDSPGFAATAAAQVYVTLVGSNTQAPDRLRRLAKWADSEMVRGAALAALARICPDKPETAELLSASVTGDPHWYVRREAVRTIAERQARDQEPRDQEAREATRELLCGRIGSDEEAPEVRATALHWLAGGWRTDETAALLRVAAADQAQFPEVRAAAVAEMAAGWHDDGQTLPWLLALADHGEAGARVAAVEALAAGWQDEAEVHDWLRKHAAADIESEARVRVAAVRGLAAGWPEEEETVALLQEKARSDGDDDPGVRQAALEALTMRQRGQTEIARWLREVIKDEPDDDVRCAMVKALGAYWQDDTGSDDLLEDRAIKDRDWYVRATAIQALAVIRASQPDFGGWLRSRADYDDHLYVRRTALSVAAAGWPEDQETVPWLRRYAENGSAKLDLRAAAVRALAVGWPDVSTLELLRAFTTTGARTEAARRVAVQTGAARRVVVQLIASRWRDDEQTYPWLRERATEDESPAVRRTALQLLAADPDWRADPATLDLLRNSAVTDESPAVREAAIRTVSAGWRDNQETAAWLREDAFAGNERLARLSVIRALASDWHDHPATLNWLATCAAADLDPPVQQAAKQACSRWT